jgi:hypothetical protein
MHMAICPLSVARAQASFYASPGLKPDLQRLCEIKTAHLTQSGWSDRRDRMRAWHRIERK